MSVDWVASFPAEIIVCAEDGTILEMNDTAVQFYQREGGRAMIGRNLYDHHQEPARSQVRQVVQCRQQVVYTTEKGGEKKLVCIAPWYEGEEHAGFALVTIDLPNPLPNIRKD